MLDLRTLIRPLLAAPFIVGGVNTLRDPQPAAQSAADVVVPIGKSMGLGSNPESLVKLNAGVQIGGGILLALGFVPRLASLLLSASLVPTTIAESPILGGARAFGAQSTDDSVRQERWAGRWSAGRRPRHRRSTVGLLERPSSREAGRPKRCRDRQRRLPHPSGRLLNAQFSSCARRRCCRRGRAGRRCRHRCSTPPSRSCTSSAPSPCRCRSR